MSIRVFIAFANAIFSEGVKALLEGERDMAALEVFSPGSAMTSERLSSLSADVILVDLTTLFNSFPPIEKPDKKRHFLLVDTNCGKDNLIAAFLKKKISGIIPADTDAAQFKKAIRTVAKGEIWIDRGTFRELLYGIHAISNAKSSLLSEREKEVIALIGSGFRNKEIAKKLNISEPTVKTHLNRIFQKLDIRTRSELVCYAIKNNDITELASILKG